jgi:uncharacterized OB-fold protein
VATIEAIGVYAPPWEVRGQRAKGPDEDALTMAVAAGRAADPAASAQRVVMVSRDFPLLEGDGGAVLLAGLSLESDVPVGEVLGSAPAVLEQLLSAGAGTLVIAADDSDHAVGAAAVLLGAGDRPVLDAVSRRHRSLPLHARGADGTRHEYVDPRLMREVGVKDTMRQLATGEAPVVAIAGVAAAHLGGDIDVSAALNDAGPSAASVLRLIAATIERGTAGLVLAFEQATASAARLTLGSTEPRIVRDEETPRELPETRVAAGTGIPISMPAYSRAFEPKLYWKAAVFEPGPGVDTNPVFPPRARVDDDGVLRADYTLADLPRTGTVYSQTTIRIPVPDLPSPYSLALVQLDNSPVRVLLKVTGVPAGDAEIGQDGAVVFRRIATRSGVPDYGYMFWPGKSVAAERSVA